MINRPDQRNIFYAFRHGETPWNRERRLQGHSEVSITKEGEEQAKSVIPFLKKSGVNFLISSDLLRAKQTAAIVSSELGLETTFDARLREVYLGQGQGKLIEEVDTYFGESFWKRWSDFGPIYDDLRFPGGESKRDVDERIRSFLDSHAELFRDRVVALCTHGFVMTRMFKILRPEIKDIWHIQNGECIEFEAKATERKSFP
ncbi:histidine phosphatase family protein [Leptospira yasudae]|uniref:histidine phosphatase family protein n=1 Tax=Leptospira yasudae TaxID=2202201 RepID=UPI000E59E572|nr:histidine phosphatase family protein [Leptospira yasudae]RHX91447.1 histidine phosphatase family protein [Leptospira yasudae]